MGSQTAHGYPYPVGTDRVSDGDNAIQALAEKTETNVRASAAGQLVVTVPSGSNTALVAVTFPVGRFLAIPSVVATANTSTSIWYAGANTPTATGFGATANHRDGAQPGVANNITVSWLATETG